MGIITNLLKQHSEKQLADKQMAIQGYQTLLSMKDALPDQTREWALDNILSLTGDVTGGGGGKGGKGGGGGKDGKPNPFRSILAAMSGLNPAPAAPKPVGRRPQQMTKTSAQVQQDQDARAAKDRTNKLADVQGEADIRRKSAVQQAGEESPILAERAGAEEAARVRANPKSAPSAEKYTPGEARYDPATKESTFPAGQKPAEDKEPGEIKAAMWAETHKTDRGPVGDAARRIISLEEKKARGPAAEGTWVPMEQNGKQVLFNPKTREVVAPPAGGELQKSGTAAKTTEPVKDALDYAQDYLSRGVFTGAGDEALQEKFFELAKPSSGFRMTKPQMDMLQKSRGWMQGFAARARHAATGQWFTDEQRRQIVDTMKNLAASKGIKGINAGSSVPAGTSAAPVGSIPPAVRSKLKEGIITTFGNGQKWTLKSGQPQQVQ